VSYSYPGSATPAIDHLSLEIEPGQQAALIGSSGAGKSTIADIICGIISPTQGVVTLSPANSDDHERITNYSVSYVPQKPGLVSGSIAENVALGMEPEEIDENRVWEAIEKAHLGAVVRSLEGGINANLGNYQDGLSGGQIQRLGLARALYSRPSLLVMDEATSALDAESEAEISKVLDQVRGEVTVVLIAHRLNTIQHADRVFLIEDGTVSDSGTFQDLLKRNQSIERLVQLMKVDEEKG
jgi:ATP-binding cassette subfamily C protein